MGFAERHAMDCERAKVHIALMLADYPEITAGEQAAFRTHLEGCPECTREYEGKKWAIELLQGYWNQGEVGESKPDADLLEDCDAGQAASEMAAVETAPPVRKSLTAKESWEDIKRRLPQLALAEKRFKRHRFMKRVAAVAACVVMAVSAWMFLVSDQTRMGDRAQQGLEQALAVEAMVQIELLTDGGNAAIAAGETIATNDGELKTLVINSRHRMVLNGGTMLAVEPLVQDGRVGCLVRLDRGEILTHVEHDGNPFVVRSEHGQAVITGTTFDIVADDDSMQLTVTEGMVRFESNENVVNVSAGYQSEIVGDASPTNPVLCDTAAVVAWAEGEGILETPGWVADAIAETDELEGISLAISLPEPLEQIDYDRWVAEHRDWFEREFPWVFEQQRELAEQGIEIGYPELMVQGGDLWRFAWPQYCSTRMLAGAADGLSVAGQVEGIEALDAWRAALSQAEQSSEVLLASLHAGMYLANCRSLVWLAMREGLLIEDASVVAEVSLLLTQQVETACANQELLIRLLSVDCSRGCCNVLLSDNTVAELQQNIVQLDDCERRLREYEIISE